MQMIRLLSIALVLSPGIVQDATAASSKAKLRKAKKVLTELKLVDGVGSGLDADTVRGLKPLVAVDSQGNIVGAVMLPDTCCNRAEFGAQVVRRIDSTPVLLHVTAAGFDNNTEPGDNSIAWYESTDCSGTPLVLPGSPFFPKTAHVAAGRIAYYGGSSPATTRTAQSVSSDCQAGGIPLADGACCSSEGTLTSSFEEAVAFDLTTLGLTPPFHMDVP